MIMFSLFLLVLSVVEIYQMKKNKNIREIALYIGLAITAGFVGLYYISDPYGKSIIYFILEILGTTY